MRGFNPFNKLTSGSIYPNKNATIFIAASNAPSDVKRYADIVCTGTADEVKINDAISSLTSVGGVIEFSSGTFTWTAATDGPTFSNKNKVSLVGKGYNTIFKGPGGADKQFFKFSGSTDLSIKDICFDLNGSTSAGGLKFDNTDRVSVRNTKCIDNNFNSTITTDRNFLYFLPSSVGEFNDDIIIENNIVQYGQVELDRCRRAIISGNIFKDTITTAAIKCLINSNSESIEDYIITNNVFYDCYGGGINIGLSSASITSATFNNFLVANNMIYVNTRTSVIGLLFGTPNTGVASTGTVFKNFAIHDNFVSYSSWLAISSDGAIRFKSSSTAAFTFSNFSIQGNYIRGGPSSGTGFIGDRLVDSLIDGNSTSGFTTGFDLNTYQNTGIRNNNAFNCTTCFDFDSILGGNVIRDNQGLGTYSTQFVFTNVNATDRIVPFVPAASDQTDTTNQFLTQSDLSGTNRTTGVVSKTGITDNSATQTFTITITNTETGTYTCIIHALISSGSGTTNSVAATRGINAAFSREVHQVGGGDTNSAGTNTTIITWGDTGSVTSGAAAVQINSVTITVVETSEIINSIRFQVDVSGTDPSFGAGTSNISVYCFVECLWQDFESGVSIASG